MGTIEGILKKHNEMLTLSIGIDLLINDMKTDYNEKISKRIREKNPVFFNGRKKETWGYDITGGNYIPIFHDVEDDMLLINHKEGFKPNQSEIKQYGLELDMFLQFQGTNLEQYKQQLQTRAATSVRYQIVLEAIANKEGLEPTEEKYEETYTMLAGQYGMEVDQLKAVFQKEMLREQLLTQLAVDFLVEKSVKA